MYLWHTEKLSTRNVEIMDEAERITTTLKGPWIIGGDMNMQPELLQPWASRNKARIFCTEAPTCNLSHYDYFIVDRAISDSVVGTQMIHNL